MSVSIIGTVGIPASYGGFESLAENLLPSHTFNLVYCSSRSIGERKSKYKGAALKYLPLDANGISSIFYDLLSILHTAFFTKNDILLLGVSGAIGVPLFKMITRRKIVTNIDGLEWRRQKWGKLARKYLKFSESIAVRWSDIVVSDNQAIADYVLEEYGIRSSMIAYGGDHALMGELPEEYVGEFALSICRIEPENNVEMILQSFSVSGRHLKFVGNWLRSEYGRKLKAKYGSFGNIDLMDPIYDIQELYKLRSTCGYYVHGHSAGGTNPSLVEIMFFGKPVLAFDCIYNRATTENMCQYFKDSQELNSVLDNFDPGALRITGKTLQEIANSKYTWHVVRKMYHALF